MQSLQPFHLAIPVHDLATCRKFYTETMGCPEGRSSDKWVDLDFYGHQLVIHETGEKQSTEANPVDGKQVPVPHFGVVLTMEQWEELKTRMIAGDTKFIIEPYVRFKGEPGEQATMFFLDPSGNALEFKAFANMDMLFEK